MHELEIRTGQPEDAPRVHAYMMEVISEPHGLIPMRPEDLPSADRHSELLARCAEDNASRWLLAFHGGSIVGGLELWRTRRSGQDHVLQLGVSTHASVRRLGVASALMTEGIRWLHSLKQDLRVEAEVLCGNAPSIALMERFGFRNEGTAQWRFRLRGELVDSLRFALTVSRSNT